MLDLLKGRKGLVRLFSAVLLFILVTTVAGALGPVFFDEDEAVSIYRDFDDGLFGRSLYRGVVFSVKLESFARYRSLPVKDFDGLTAYLLSPESARILVEDSVNGVFRKNRISGAPAEDGEEPGFWLFRFVREGIEIEFSLERAPEDLMEEVDRTYPNNPNVARQVKDGYKEGWVIRIHVAENVYQPGVARIEYEDVMICAALLGEDFQPLWGLHDGNNLLSGE